LEEPQQIDVSVDMTPPAVTSFLSGPATDGWRVLNTSFTLEASDLGSGLASVEYQLDGGAWTQYSNSLDLTDGRHVLLYRASDNVGNNFTSSEQQVNIDTIAPQASVVASPDGKTISVHANDTMSGLCTMALIIDGGSPLPLAIGPAWQGVFFDLAPGDHEIRLVVTDVAGNQVVQAQNVSVASPPSDPMSLLIPIIVILAAIGVAAVVLMRRRR
jgi:hypothetical protein